VVPRIRSQADEDPGKAYFAAEDVITALYRTILLRDPDSEGLQSRLTLGNDITRIIESFFHSYEFAFSHAAFVERHINSHNLRFTNNASEHGELESLFRRWVNKSATHRIVVDVGARGRRLSNSYDLLRFFGWRGLLVEANPRLISTIIDEFAGLEVEVVNCAVSDYTGRSFFYIADKDEVSSLNERWAKVLDRVEVPVERLGDLLHARDIPKDFDLLSIDIEGEDIKVLNDTVGAFAYHPRWIIVEAFCNAPLKSLGELSVSDEIKSRYVILDQTPSNLILEAI